MNDISDTELIASKGKFTAHHNNRLGLTMLFHGATRIADISSGKSLEEVHGSIDNWIKKITKRTTTHLSKIEEMRNELNREEESLSELLQDLINN